MNFRKLILLLIIVVIYSSCNKNQNIADASGNFESDATTISAENIGQLLSFDIQEGEQLKKGKVVGYIDTTQLYLKKKLLLTSYSTIASKSKSVLSQIDVLNAQLKVQNVNLQRINKMFSEGSATKKQLDDIEGLINITKQQITAVRAQNVSTLSQLESLNVQVQQVEDQISKSILVAPTSGTVLVKYAEQYEFVAPGKPLYQIQNMNMLKLKAYVIEPQLSEIKIGQKVIIEIDANAGEKKYEGIITWISAEAEFTPKIIQTKDERKNLVYAIKIDVKNDGSLKVGMPASVYFE